MCNLFAKPSEPWVDVLSSCKKWPTSVYNVYHKLSKLRSLTSSNSQSSSCEIFSGSTQTSMRDFWVTFVKIWSPLTTQKPKLQSYGSLVSMWKWSKMRMSFWATLLRISRTSQTSFSTKFWSAAWSFTYSSHHKAKKFSKIFSGTLPKSVKTPTCVTEATFTGGCCRPIQNSPRISCSKKGHSSQTSLTLWKPSFWKNWFKISDTCQVFIANNLKTS